MSANRSPDARGDDASTILATAAHELKNALGGLGVVLARCEQRLASGQPVTAEHIGSARGEVRRLSALVNDLLDGARVDLGMWHLVRRDVDLGALARDTVATFREAHHREVQLEQPPAPVIAPVDAERVRAALVNFLENAAKFAPPPSPVAVRVAASPAVEGRAVRISVTDHGPGIHADDRARLFQRFFRGPSVAKRTHGLGLGLYLCRAVAEAHGGRVGFDSVFGRGATFWIELPVTGPAAEEAEPARPPPP